LLNREGVVGHFASQMALLAAGRSAKPRQVRLATLCCLLASTAFGQERWDHQGSLGLTIAGGYENRTSITIGNADTGHRLIPELGGTLALTRSWSVRLAGRVAFFGPQLGLSFIGGVRSSFGDRFKTFADLDLAVHAIPIFTIGPRVAFGVQYELSEVIGVFASAGVQLGVAPRGIRFGAEVLIGLQFRTYVLEERAFF
jgi:hypothetical protein